MILYEQNTRNLRIYNGATMKHEVDIPCSSYIISVEYISDKNSICVALSDRTLIFIDASSSNYKITRKFNLPST